MAYITARGLAVGYGAQAVAENIEFAVDRGDYLCIVGENGAGKTTLMKTMLGLQDPLSGSVEIGGGADGGRIGYLPQQTVVQKDFPASVTEVVLSGCQNSAGFKPFYSKSDKDRALSNMKRMGVDGLRNRSYRELSGGQQQRVLLARALCAADSMLILDEPVAGLDPAAAQELYGLIEGLNRGGMTIVMISHDIAAAVRYASHILMVGSEPFFGTKEEYIRSGRGRVFMERGGEDNGR